MIYFIGEKVDFEGIENSTIEYLLDYFKNKSEIAFDTETTGFDPYIDKLLTYQLGDRVHQFVVDATLYPIELIKDLLINKELIIHNAKFDLSFLYYHKIYPSKVWDTYIGECVLYKGNKTVRKSLEATVKRYFNYNLNKFIRGKIFKERYTKRVIEYCAEDTTFLIDIKSIQWDRMNKQDLLSSMSLENLFVKVLTYIEYSGIYINKKLWQKKIEQDTINKDSSLLLMNQWIIDNKITRFIDTQYRLYDNDTIVTINWDSPKQVTDVFTRLGIDTKIPDDVTGDLKDSVEYSILEKQQDLCSLIPIYLQYKKYAKILSTYGETVINKIHPVTGRIHTSFTQIMNTGRLSSGGKRGDTDTINLQNIPGLPDKKYRVEGKIYERECFTCKEGNTLINADYSGQEQVVFANWTLDPDLLAFYKKDLGDMHSYIASKIFPYLADIPLKDIKAKYPDERQKAKSAGFALNYGGNGSTLVENLGISIEEGDAIYKAYFEAFPAIDNYFKQVTKKALQTGYVQFNEISKSRCYIYFFDQFQKLEYKVTSSGFWEKYREEKDLNSILYQKELKPLVSKYFKLRSRISRMAINYRIQGSSAEITKLAGIFIFEYIVKNKYTS